MVDGTIVLARELQHVSKRGQDQQDVNTMMQGLLVVPEPSLAPVPVVCVIALLGITQQRRKGLLARVGEGECTLTSEA